jgi:hypothetical protein
MRVLAVGYARSGGAFKMQTAWPFVSYSNLQEMICDGWNVVCTPAPDGRAKYGVAFGADLPAHVEIMLKYLKCDGDIDGALRGKAIKAHAGMFNGKMLAMEVKYDGTSNGTYIQLVTSDGGFANDAKFLNVWYEFFATKSSIYEVNQYGINGVGESVIYSIPYNAFTRSVKNLKTVSSRKCTRVYPIYEDTVEDTVEASNAYIRPVETHYQKIRREAIEEGKVAVAESMKRIKLELDFINEKIGNF